MALALITGASSGLGELFAERFASRGDDVILVARRQERLDALAKRLMATRGITAHVIVADLASAAGPEHVLAELSERGLVVDYLVNNAGYAIAGKFVDVSAADSLGQVGVNVAALTALTAGLLPGMVHRNRGGVLNVASVAGFQPIPEVGVYAATKAYVVSLSESLWHECRGTKVRIMALCPGATKTEFFDVSEWQLKFGGRQEAPQVVDLAMTKFFGSDSPTVISGALNMATAAASRFLPRRWVPGLVDRISHGPRH